MLEPGASWSQTEKRSSAVLNSPAIFQAHEAGACGITPGSGLLLPRFSLNLQGHSGWCLEMNLGSTGPFYVSPFSVWKHWINVLPQLFVVACLCEWPVRVGAPLVPGSNPNLTNSWSEGVRVSSTTTHGKAEQSFPEPPPGSKPSDTNSFLEQQGRD